ncbi:uncharacterized protein LOC105703850 isoform X2 [Orussus abietinus]|nr:uncharacterized protein LOC105703850 isoform X2 [Orussus abietinus]
MEVHRQGHSPHAELPTSKAKREQALRNILAARRRQILGQRSNDHSKIPNPIRTARPRGSMTKNTAEILEAQESRHAMYVAAPPGSQTEIDLKEESGEPSKQIPFKVGSEALDSTKENRSVTTNGPTPARKIAESKSSSNESSKIWPSEDKEGTTLGSQRMSHRDSVSRDPSIGTLITQKNQDHEVKGRNTVSMPESLYNHFRPVESNIPVEDMTQFLYFGQKLHPETPNTTSSNSVEVTSTAPTVSSSRKRYNSKRFGATVASTVPRLEDIMNEEMNITVERQTVERNKVSRIKNTFRSPGSGLYYRKPPVRPSDPTIVSNVIPTRDNRNSTVAGSSVKSETDSRAAKFPTNPFTHATRDGGSAYDNSTKSVDEPTQIPKVERHRGGEKRLPDGDGNPEGAIDQETRPKSEDGNAQDRSTRQQAVNSETFHENEKNLRNLKGPLVENDPGRGSVNGSAGKRTTIELRSEPMETDMDGQHSEPHKKTGAISSSTVLDTVSGLPVESAKPGNAGNPQTMPETSGNKARSAPTSTPTPPGETTEPRKKTGAITSSTVLDTFSGPPVESAKPGNAGNPQTMPEIRGSKARSASTSTPTPPGETTEPLRIVVPEESPLPSNGTNVSPTPTGENPVKALSSASHSVAPGETPSTPNPRQVPSPSSRPSPAVGSTSAPAVLTALQHVYAYTITNVTRLLRNYTGPGLSEEKRLAVTPGVGSAAEIRTSRPAGIEAAHPRPEPSAGTAVEGAAASNPSERKRKTGLHRPGALPRSGPIGIGTGSRSGVAGTGTRPRNRESDGNEERRVLAKSASAVLNQRTATRGSGPHDRAPDKSAKDFQVGDRVIKVEVDEIAGEDAKEEVKSLAGEKREIEDTGGKDASGGQGLQEVGHSDGELKSQEKVEMGEESGREVAQDASARVPVNGTAFMGENEQEGTTVKSMGDAEVKKARENGEQIIAPLVEPGNEEEKRITGESGEKVYRERVDGIPSGRGNISDAEKNGTAESVRVEDVGKRPSSESDTKSTDEHSEMPTKAFREPDETPGTIPVFPVTPKILTDVNRTSTDDGAVLKSANTTKSPDPRPLVSPPESKRPFGIAEQLDPSEIQKLYRSSSTAKPEGPATLDVTTENPTLDPQEAPTISPFQEAVSKDPRKSSERSPEVRARNLSDENKDKDDVLPIMHLYNTSDIFNGSVATDSRTRGTASTSLDLPTKAHNSEAHRARADDGVSASKTTTANPQLHGVRTKSGDDILRHRELPDSIEAGLSGRKDRPEGNRDPGTTANTRASNSSGQVGANNRTRHRPAYHYSLPDFNGSTVYPAELNRTFFEPGLMVGATRDAVNISEVISKRHDGDTIATQETVAVVSYILATLVVFPIAVGVGLILRRLIIRNRKVLEESDTSSEISCRKNALNLESGDFKTSIEKAITKLPRIQHLCHEAEKPPPPPQQESRWEFPRDKLRLQTVLGQGNFGQVWKAEADDLTGHQGTTRLVAVKTVKQGASAREKEDLVRELEIMQQLGNHPNVVTLLGCCTEEEPHYLILEYVMYGKLLAYLRDHRTRQDFYNFSEDSAALTSRDLTVFGYCVARGMEYLASKKIIHRDLAARNVLVDHNKLCKIADFGMSRFANEDGEIIETRHGRNALPIRWMAPESLIYSLFTTKTDVWSFGILMWEIVTLGSTPYPDMSAREVMRNVQSGYRLERPSHCRSELFRVISRCWHADPDRRPEFQTLRRDLAQLLEDNMNGHYVDLESFASECTD